MTIKSLKSVFTAAFAVAALTVVGTNVQAQNLLNNASFESAILGNEPATSANFSGFSIDDTDATSPLPTNSSGSALTGTMGVEASILGFDNGFVGIQQNFDNIIPGETYTYTINAATNGDPLGLNVEYRLEYLDATGAFAGGQFDNNIDITTDLSGTFSSFTQTSVAPANAVTGRAVLALQSFAAGDNNTGTVFLDDFSVTGNVATIPEPSSLSLLAAGLIGLVARRRRS